MTTSKMVIFASCLDCEENINLGPKPTIGHKLTCPYCGAYLAVADLDPPELDWDMGDFDDEDWDDEDWDDEE